MLLTSGQIVLLEPYHRSLGKRLVKSPKLYFADTGLAAYLAGFQSAGALLASPAIGAFWENHVVGQWIRYRDWYAPALQLWFWQDRTGREVDLLIEADQRLVPVECKWKERPDAGDAVGIRRLRALYGSAVADGFVACTAASAFQVAPGVTAVSGWRLRPSPSGDVRSGPGTVQLGEEDAAVRRYCPDSARNGPSRPSGPRESARAARDHHPRPSTKRPVSRERSMLHPSPPRSCCAPGPMSRSRSRRLSPATIATLRPPAVARATGATVVREPVGSVARARNSSERATRPAATWLAFQSTRT